MKKLTFIFAALAAAFAVSCTKEAPVADVDAPAAVGMKTVTITASIDDLDTKTSYDAAGKFSWTKGDQISVKGSDNVFYTFTATTSAAESAFTGVIPEGVTLKKHAVYPADPGHAINSSSYTYNIPEYKDLTGKSTAEIPMSSYVSDGVYNFMHMTGAVLLTFLNVPDGVESVEISIVADGVRLSGAQEVWTGTPWSFSAASAANESEKTFTRKVSVENNQAKLYLPYKGEFWDGCTINITGFDASGNSVVLLTGKRMKGSSANVLTPALVIPYAPLVLSNLDNVDWDNALTTTVDPSAQYSRLSELKVHADDYFMYVRLKASIAAEYSGDYLDIFLSDGAGETKAWWGWSTTGTCNYTVGLSGHKGSVDKTTGNLTEMSFILNDAESTSVNVDSKSEVVGDDVYWYMAYPREYLEPYVSSTGKVYVSFMLWNSWDPYGVIPTINTSMLEVTLP